MAPVFFAYPKEFMDLTPTTELDAVNEMLGAVGELPVSDLEIVGNTDTAIAINTLRGISREIQSKGWWFNTDEFFAFTLNVEGKAQLPSPILSIRPLGRGSPRLTTRAGFLYSLSAASDVFDLDAPPSARVVWFYDFETLPESARRYVAIRAARIFQKNTLGSDSLDKFTEEHETTAYGIFFSEQDDFEFAQGHNFLNDDADTAAIANRV